MQIRRSASNQVEKASITIIRKIQKRKEDEKTNVIHEEI